LEGQAIQMSIVSKLEQLACPERALIVLSRNPQKSFGFVFEMAAKIVNIATKLATSGVVKTC
jgi:hypothetical protein